MLDDFTNEIVEQNLSLGPVSLLPFKKIIKKTAYPSSLGEMDELSIINDIVDAYKIMDHDSDNALELMVYAAECAMHYVADTYELEHTSYEAAYNIFKSASTAVASSTPELISQFGARLEQLNEMVKMEGFSCCDEAKKFWVKSHSKSNNKKIILHNSSNVKKRITSSSTPI